MMKLKTKTLLAAALCGLMAPSTIFAEKHDHDHEKHDVEGPNKGRMILKVEPHAEFLVTKDRKVQITFVDDHGKVVPVEKQKVSVICGDRSKPTVMKMEKKDGKLISSNTIPDGNDFPMIISFKMTPDAKTVREKFNLNTNACPDCKLPEYRCACEDHDHKGHKH